MSTTAKQDAAAPAAPPADGGPEGLRAYVNKIIAGHPGLETPEDHVGWLDAGLCEIDRRLVALSSRTPAGAAGDPVGKGNPVGDRMRAEDAKAHARGDYRHDPIATRPASPAPAASAGGEAATVLGILQKHLTAEPDHLLTYGTTPYRVAGLAEASVAVAAALAPAAQVNPGRKETARIIKDTWDRLTVPIDDHGICGLGGAWTRTALCEAMADAILAARPVAEGDAGETR